MNPLLLLLGIICAASTLPAPSDVILIESSNEAKKPEGRVSNFVWFRLNKLNIIGGITKIINILTPLCPMQFYCWYFP